MKKKRSFALKMGFTFALLASVTAVYSQYGHLLDLEYLATQEEFLQNYRNQHPWLVYLAAFLVYALAAGLSVPGAAALTVLCCWFLGLVPGLIVSSFASTAGATIAFLLSRTLFRDMVQNRFSERLNQFNTALERDGPLFLFTLRLIPALPFFVINVVMGLTSMKTVTYCWVSQLGMLPGTAAFVYAGSVVPSLGKLAEQGTAGILSPRIVAAFVLLGMFPLVARWLVRKLPSRTVENAPQEK